jgi:hypothetical protein
MNLNGMEENSRNTSGVKKMQVVIATAKNKQVSCLSLTYPGNPHDKGDLTFHYLPTECACFLIYAQTPNHLKIHPLVFYINGRLI